MYSMSESKRQTAQAPRFLSPFTVRDLSSLEQAVSLRWWPPAFVPLLLRFCCQPWASPSGRRATLLIGLRVAWSFIKAGTPSSPKEARVAEWTGRGWKESHSFSKVSGVNSGALSTAWQNGAPGLVSWIEESRPHPSAGSRLHCPGLASTLCPTDHGGKGLWK